MPIDKEVGNAVFKATQNNNQPEKAGRRIIQWLEQLSDGNANLSNPDDIKSSLSIILDAIQIDDFQDNDED